MCSRSPSKRSLAGARPWRRLVAVFLGALPVYDAAPASAEERTLALADGGVLTYRFDAPDGFDAAKPVPVLIALPPGALDAAMVATAAELYWTEEGRRRGWLVVGPATPGPAGDREALAAALPELVDALEAELTVAGGKVHLAGVSNGGRAAFAAALAHPERYASLTALPGLAPEDAELARLADLPIALFVGGDDTDWLDRMTAQRERLLELGHARVTLDVFPGEGHVPPSLTGDQLFDALAVARIHARLDELHRAASEARLADYEACFAEDAVFFGTDATERWLRDDLIAYATPSFEAGRGWTYHPRARAVHVAADGRLAWFDERLDHAEYGELRGTGVLRRTGPRWEIVQYNLAFTVPNEVADRVVRTIRER